MSFAGKIHKQENNTGQASHQGAKLQGKSSNPVFAHPDPWMAEMAEIMNNDSSPQAVFQRKMSDIMNNPDAPQTSLQRTMSEIQAKLEIGEPNDKYEQQADAVADAVVAAPTDAVQTMPMEKEEGMQMIPEEEKIQGVMFDEDKDVRNDLLSAKFEVQRMPVDWSADDEKVQKMEEDKMLQPKFGIQKSADGTSQATPALISQLNSNKGGGQSVPEQMQWAMGEKVPADFSSVRLHSDNRAAEMSSSIGAKAFTHGSDIYFNKGQYNPTSQSGKHLLAHELTHTVQQGAGSIRRQAIGTQDKNDAKKENQGKTKQDQQSKPNMAKLSDRQLAEFVAAVYGESSAGGKQYQSIGWFYANRVNYMGFDKAFKGSAAYTGQTLWYKAAMYTLGYTEFGNKENELAHKTYTQLNGKRLETVKDYCEKHTTWKYSYYKLVLEVKEWVKNTVIAKPEENPFKTFINQGYHKDFNSMGNATGKMWYQARHYVYLYRKVQKNGAIAVFGKEIEMEKHFVLVDPGTKNMQIGFDSRAIETFFNDNSDFAPKSSSDVLYYNHLTDKFQEQSPY